MSAMRVYQYEDPSEPDEDDPESGGRTVWIAAANEDYAVDFATERGLKACGGMIFDEAKTREMLEAEGKAGIDVVIRRRDFVSTYSHCGQTWQSRWSCACDDECPVCGAPIEASSWEEDFDIEGVTP